MEAGVGLGSLPSSTSTCIGLTLKLELDRSRRQELPERETMTTTTYENILVDRVDGGVGIVTLNRPRVLNALNFGLVSELDAVLTDFEHDDDIRAVVITGAGEKAFSAGADIHENVDLDRPRPSAASRSAPSSSGTWPR